MSPNRLTLALIAGLLFIGNGAIAQEADSPATTPSKEVLPEETTDVVTEAPSSTTSTSTMSAMTSNPAPTETTKDPSITSSTSATSEETSSTTSPSTTTKTTSNSTTEDKTMDTSSTNSAKTDSEMNSSTTSPSTTTTTTSSSATEEKTMDTSNTDSASTDSVMNSSNKTEDKTVDTIDTKSASTDNQTTSNTNPEDKTMDHSNTSSASTTNETSEATPPIAEPQNVCQKPLDRGSCEKKRARYFYNAEKMRCENFGACPVDGDVNNFATEEECVARCQPDSPSVESSPSPSVQVGNAVTLPLAVNDTSMVPVNNASSLPASAETSTTTTNDETVDPSTTQADGALSDHEAGCDPNCPRILKHVCGSDGVTYNNECLLKLKACKSGDALVAKAHDGMCDTKSPSSTSTMNEKSTDSSNTDSSSMASATTSDTTTNDKTMEASNTNPASLTSKMTSDTTPEDKVMDSSNTNSPTPTSTATTTTSTATSSTSATSEKTSSTTSPSTSTKPTSKSSTEDITMDTSKTDSASTDSAMTSNTNSEDKTIDTSNTDSASTTSSPSPTNRKDSNKTSTDKTMDTTSHQDNADGSDSTKKIDDAQEKEGKDNKKDDDDEDDDDEEEDDDEEDEDGSGEPRLFPSPPQGLSKVVDSVSDFAARVKSGRSRHSKMIDTDVEPAENADDILFESEDESSLAPVFVTHPSMIQFFAPGEPFALVCSAESPAAAAGGEVRYSWTRNGRLMDMADAAARRVFRENAAANGNLIFVSPGTGDVGTYTCLAENEHGKTYSRGSVVMVRKEEAESSDGEGEETSETETEAGDDNEAVGEREPRKEGVFLVYPTVVEEAAAQIVEDAGAGIADSVEE